MSELFAAVCSIAPTRRRRFLWAAWWTGAPEREPFRKPDASEGGARTRAEALAAAERAAGRRLVEVEPLWARAWARVLQGEPAFPRGRAEDAAPRRAKPARADAPAASVWQVLGVAPGASADELKRAYHQRALETHPDHGGDPDTFREVQAAYERATARTAKRTRRPRRK